MHEEGRNTKDKTIKISCSFFSTLREISKTLEVNLGALHSSAFHGVAPIFYEPYALSLHT